MIIFVFVYLHQSLGNLLCTTLQPLHHKDLKCCNLICCDFILCDMMAFDIILMLVHHRFGNFLLHHVATNDVMVVVQ